MAGGLRLVPHRASSGMVRAGFDQDHPSPICGRVALRPIRPRPLLHPPRTGVQSPSTKLSASRTVQDDPLYDIPQSEAEWTATKALHAIRATGGDDALASFLVRATMVVDPPRAEVVPIRTRKRVPMAGVSETMLMNAIQGEAVAKAAFERIRLGSRVKQGHGNAASIRADEGVCHACRTGARFLMDRQEPSRDGYDR